MIKNLPAVQTWVQPLGQEDPLEKEWQPTPVFLPGEVHGQGSLAGYSSWGHKESDRTEQLTFTFTALHSQGQGLEKETVRGLGTVQVGGAPTGVPNRVATCCSLSSPGGPEGPGRASRVGLLTFWPYPSEAILKSQFQA